MTFQGQVGALSGQDFIEFRYALALFTYVYEDAAAGQAFRVLNFWVD